VHDGVARLGQMQVPFPDYPQCGGTARGASTSPPHELDITLAPEGENSIKAKVLHVNPAGSVVRFILRVSTRTPAFAMTCRPADLGELG